jgi:DNA repair exonuclease SbcCD nuclease subunit
VDRPGERSEPHSKSEPVGKRHLTLVHAADLHLCEADADYCLDVLDELMDLCVKVQASVLLLAGDIFDSFDAAEALREPFRSRVERLDQRCKVLFLPGNHDEQRQGPRRLGALDLGPVMLLDRRPFSLVRFEEEGVEVVAVPEQRDYDDYRRWGVPAKAAPVRIVLAHGIVRGMAYTGPAAGDEGGDAPAGQLEPRLFQELQADYAALGHLHGRRQAIDDGVTLSYPGSARVWRRGESGEHGVWRLAAGRNGVTSEFVPLVSAGQYRVHEVPVDLSGTVDLAPLRPESWNRNDWVVLHATGVVEDENDLPSALADLRRRYAGTVRRIEIDTTDCEAMPGIASQPLARRFLQVWAASEPQDPAERPAWLRARQLGLLAIKHELAAGR